MVGRKILMNFVFLMFFIQLIAVAQEKRPLTHDDYDTWESTSAEKITKNGQWVGFRVNLQDGDGKVRVLSAEDPKQSFIERRYPVHPSSVSLSLSATIMWYLSPISNTN